ncbi:MAG TPA: magnesium transporter [Woeseiaceae bacterium]|nr:magnesium transporter [Woeseiaceae bacterium]
MQHASVDKGKVQKRWKLGPPGELDERNRPILRHVERLLAEREVDTLLEYIGEWRPAELVDLMIHLPLARARLLYEWLPLHSAMKTLAEVSPELRALLLEESGVTRIRQILGEMDTDDQVDMLVDLPDELVEKLLPTLPNQGELRARLAYEEDTAGAIMSNRFVAVLDDWDVGTATRQIRRNAKHVKKIYELYVVDEARKLVGYLKLRDLLLNKKHVPIRSIMRERPVSVSADTDQEEVLALAERQQLVTIPVVDSERRVLGRITIDELKQVAREEAEEDQRLMSGVSPDARADAPVLEMVRHRLPWLIAGLGGSAIAASVVAGFEEELARVAIIASFIPIVMAMAGNAGIQAATITVQSLAAGNLWIGDLRWRLGKEFLSSVVNGIAVALLTVLLVAAASLVIEFEAPLRLAIAAGISVAVVTVLAAVLGSTVPLVLDYFDIDPAVATGVFITTCNDVIAVLMFFLITTRLYLAGI